MPNRGLERIQEIISERDRVFLIEENKRCLKEEQKTESDIKGHMEHFEESISILEESGIESIFEEIRNSGFCHYEICKKKIPVYKDKFFRGKVVDRYDEKEIIVPAIISRNYPISESFIRENIRKPYVNGFRYANQVVLALKFNNTTMEVNETSVPCHSEIRIVVCDKKLTLVRPLKNVKFDEYDNGCTTIESGKIEESITDAFENPLIVFNSENLNSRF